MVQGVLIEDDYLVNTNPATGEVISRVKTTSPEELDSMIESSREAQTLWKALSCEERVSMLKDAIQAVKGVSDDLAKSMVHEMGKPIGEAQDEMDAAVNNDEYMDILLDCIKPKTYGSSTIVRHPYGVVAIMSPWNFPVGEITLLALPSLASGNTVIVKPSEVVPGTAALLVSTMQSVLPHGVIQIAQGAGSVGAALVSHPGIDMVAMTGSSATGRKILESAAPQLKRVLLEMGGKDPMIVLKDADLEKAAKDAVMYSLSNTGQVCCSIERIYVDEAVYDEFQELTTAVAAEYKVGDGMDPTNKVGPMVSHVQKELVKEQVDDAIAKGATVLLQSEVPESSSAEGGGGSFFPVTVLADVDEGMQLFTKETFGPVVAMAKFDGSEEEAVRLANKTEYGLGSSVYTGDLEKARRIATQIDAGQVGINCYVLEKMDVHCPWYVYPYCPLGVHAFLTSNSRHHLHPVVSHACFRARSLTHFLSNSLHLKNVF
jgi:succinate-semialdehyde dehydrogenase/glutarate-semialdehyde dehydrogenase